MEDAKFKFQKSVGQTAEATSIPPLLQTVEEKAVLFYQSCMVKTDGSIENFRNFLQSRRLPWPQVDRGAKVLDILMDLSLSWYFPVFFYVFVSIANTTRLVFQNAQFGVSWMTLRIERGMRKSNKEHIRTLYNALKESSQPSATDIFCEKMDSIQGTILDSLASSNTLKYEFHENLSRFVKAYTPSIPEAEWAHSANMHLPKTLMISTSNQAEVHNAELMKTVGSLLMKRDKNELLLFLGLSVVEGLGRFACRELALLIYGDSAGFQDRHSSLCYQFTESVMSHAWVLPHLVGHITNERIAKVVQIDNVVRESMQRSLNLAGWLDAETRNEGQRKLSQIQLSFEWKLDGHAQWIQKGLPNMGNNFLNNLKRIPLSYWGQLNKDFEHQRLAERLKNESYSQYRIFYAPHKVHIPDINLLQTVTPGDAYESINYATLGSLISSQYVAAFDTVGRTIDSHWQKRKWFSAQALWQQNKNILCVVNAFRNYNNMSATNDLEYNTIDSAVFVAAAHLAPLFDALTYSPGFPDWSRGFWKYSAEQLFFLSFCFSRCGHEYVIGGFNRATWCNIPLALFQPFSSAFDCSKESPMNQVGSCRIW